MEAPSNPTTVPTVADRERVDRFVYLRSSYRDSAVGSIHLEAARNTTVARYVSFVLFSRNYAARSNRHSRDERSNGHRRRVRAPCFARVHVPGGRTHTLLSFVFQRGEPPLANSRPEPVLRTSAGGTLRSRAFTEYRSPHAHVDDKFR